jgi:predicted transposase/invertase (TIGR01784 family)
VARLDPTLDVVFKLLLTSEPELLADMLEGVLARPVGVPCIIDAAIPGDRVGDKKVIFDLHAKLADGTRADVEMQRHPASDLLPRLIYYGTRDYSIQLRRGNGYELLTSTNVIAWLVEPLFPNLNRLHSIFELRERHTNVPFGEPGKHLAIHLLQLRHLSPSRAMGYAARVERWARFFTARSDAALYQLASEDPIMSLAKKTLDRLSKDPEAQYLAERRADELRLYRHSLLTSEARGEARGQGKVLLKQLGLRFGLVSETTRARIETATLEQLDAWAGRILTARSLDEVFVP